MEFKHWPKIPRIENEIWEVTEKIDGTNGLIAIEQNTDGTFNIKAGSRNKWLGYSKQDDNHGFGSWVIHNIQELLKLGPGYHYGEWYGQGIQRGYGLKEKRFVLFYLAKNAIKPDCCDIVPTINVFGHNKENDEVGSGLYSAIHLSINLLRTTGSVLVPGYMNPEGIIIRSTLTGKRYKYILNKS